MKHLIISGMSIFLMMTASWAEVDGVSVEEGNIYGQKYKTDSGKSIEEISKVDAGAVGEAALTGNTKAVDALGKADKKILKCNNVMGENCERPNVSAAKDAKAQQSTEQDFDVQ